MRCQSIVITPNLDNWLSGICQSLLSVASTALVHHRGLSFGWDLSIRLTTENKMCSLSSKVWYSRRDFKKSVCQTTAQKILLLRYIQVPTIMSQGSFNDKNPTEGLYI